MTGIEVQVIRLIHELGKRAAGPNRSKGATASHTQIARKLVLSEDFVSEVCQHLVEDGYLRHRSDGQFRLTDKSLEEISPVVSRGPIGVLKGGV